MDKPVDARGPTEGRSNPVQEMERRLLRPLVWISASILFVLMVLTACDVVGRTFGQPVPGTFEITEILMVLLIFSALPLLAHHDEHVTVDLLLLRFPMGLQRLIRVLVSIIATGALGIVAWRLWIKAAETAQAGETTASLHIPLGPFGYVAAIGAGLAAVAHLVYLIRICLYRPDAASAPLTK